jgi:ribosomal protein S25/predicted GIY-YIG superfamily endonuclease
MRKKSNMKGWYIYLISAGNNNFKIGIAIDPYKRLRVLNSGNPVKLKLLLSVYLCTQDNAIEIEKNVHKELGNHRRKNGEWFTLSAFDLRALTNYLMGSMVIDYEKMESNKSVEKQDKTNENINDNELFDKAKNLINIEGRASSSLLQRKLSIGYARAARIIDMLEKEGLVTGFNGSKARNILIQ